MYDLKHPKAIGPGRDGWDAETQRRLTLPQNEEEAQYRKDMAAQHGKRGKEVAELLSRQKRLSKSL